MVLPYEVANVLARLVFDGALGGSHLPEVWARNAADVGLPVELIS